MVDIFKADCAIKLLIDHDRHDQNGSNTLAMQQFAFERGEAVEGADDGFALGQGFEPTGTERMENTGDFSGTSLAAEGGTACPPFCIPAG